MENSILKTFSEKTHIYLLVCGILYMIQIQFGYIKRDN